MGKYRKFWQGPKFRWTSFFQTDSSGWIFLQSIRNFDWVNSIKNLFGSKIQVVQVLEAYVTPFITAICQVYKKWTIASSSKFYSKIWIALCCLIKQEFWKVKIYFKKLEYRFLVESTTIEKTPFPFTSYPNVCIGSYIHILLTCLSECVFSCEYLKQSKAYYFINCCFFYLFNWKKSKFNNWACLHRIKNKKSKIKKWINNNIYLTILH